MRARLIPASSNRFVLPKRFANRQNGQKSESSNRQNVLQNVLGPFPKRFAPQIVFRWGAKRFAKTICRGALRGRMRLPPPTPARSAESLGVTGPPLARGRRAMHGGRDGEGAAAWLCRGVHLSPPSPHAVQAVCLLSAWLQRRAASNSDRTYLRPRCPCAHVLARCWGRGNALLQFCAGKSICTQSAPPCAHWSARRGATRAAHECPHPTPLQGRGRP